VGAGIRPRRVDEAVSIMDFAPTFARLLDVDFPDVTGRPIACLLGPG